MGLKPNCACRIHRSALVDALKITLNRPLCTDLKLRGGCQCTAAVSGETVLLSRIVLSTAGTSATKCDPSSGSPHLAVILAEGVHLQRELSSLPGTATPMSHLVAWLHRNRPAARHWKGSWMPSRSCLHFHWDSGSYHRLYRSHRRRILSNQCILRL